MRHAPFFLLFVAPVWAGDITYYVNEEIPKASVYGTITTDGVIGPAFGHIVDWNLVVSDGVNTGEILGPLSGSNSGFGATSGIYPYTDLIATATELIWDPNPSNFGYFGFGAENSLTGFDEVCWNSEYLACTDGPSGGYNLWIYVDGKLYYGDAGEVILPSTPEQSTPEPATLAMVFAGFFLLLQPKFGRLRICCNDSPAARLVTVR
jgi:hypothetical protein